MELIDELANDLKYAVYHLKTEYNWNCECNNKTLQKQKCKCLLCKFEETLNKYNVLRHTI